MNGQQHAVEVLLVKGANIDQKDKDGEFISFGIYVLTISFFF